MSGKPERDSKDANIEELNQKLIQYKKELNDMKMSYTMKCKENETLAKENAELKERELKYAETIRHLKN